MDNVRTIRSLWRGYSRELKDNPSLTRDIKIGIAGSFTVDNLVPHIGGSLLQKGFCAPDIAVAPYNQIHQTCFDYKSAFGGADDLDAIILLLRLEDIFPQYLEEALLKLHNSKAYEEIFQKMADELRQLALSIKKLRSGFSGTIIVSSLPYPFLNSFDIHDLGQDKAGGAIYNDLIAIWNEEISAVKGLRSADIAGLLMNTGFAKAHDVRKWYLYRQPYSEEFGLEIGSLLARIIAAGKISAKKCVVLDCDNTLWGGIIGEDGISSIEIGDDFPGLAFKDFQKYLLYLRSRGIMLAIASKNNEEDVFEVLDNHDAMVLRRDHFSAFEIHWDSKVKSIKNVASDLNIGLDSLVFVDDNKKEIGEVRERLPEVTCFLVPEDLAELPSILKNTGLFDIENLTKEDRSRALMMAQEAKRKQAAQEVSEEEFRASLGLKVKVFEIEDQHLGRTTQLINKTNQFNLTTIRRNSDQVKALAGADDSIVLAAEIEDRYGAYGLVGVAVLKRRNAFASDREIWDIDTFLMSCRVLGRGAETAFLAKIIEAARRLGADEVRGKYIPTQKNRLVKDIYKNHTFDYHEDCDEWSIDAKKPLEVAEYIKSNLTLLRSS